MRNGNKRVPNEKQNARIHHTPVRTAGNKRAVDTINVRMLFLFMPGTPTRDPARKSLKVFRFTHFPPPTDPSCRKVRYDCWPVRVVHNFNRSGSNTDRVSVRRRSRLPFYFFFYFSKIKITSTIVKNVLSFHKSYIILYCKTSNFSNRPLKFFKSNRYVFAFYRIAQQKERNAMFT